MKRVVLSGSTVYRIVATIAFGSVVAEEAAFLFGGTCLFAVLGPPAFAVASVQTLGDRVTGRSTPSQR